MAAIFSHAETDHLAGVPLPVAPAARPVAVPRGPRGLWDAMAKATGAHREVPAPVAAPDATAVVALAGEAHLAYLARLTGSASPAPAPAETEPEPAGAEVIDLAAERARRR